uniref:Regulator of G protein signaling 13 n=1 Tax=Neogobius melanostomus TaxID=47308 RepID=A0A8C6U7Q0_9GOBI
MPQLCFEELSQWSHSLERLLTSKCMLIFYKAFLKSEYSDENIEFWLICEEYKKIKCSYMMSTRARKIFKRYIQAEAPKERDNTKKYRRAHRFGLMEKDSYPRFLKSNAYRALFDAT